MPSLQIRMNKQKEHMLIHILHRKQMFDLLYIFLFIRAWKINNIYLHTSQLDFINKKSLFTRKEIFIYTIYFLYTFQFIIIMYLYLLTTQIVFELSSRILFGTEYFKICCIFRRDLSTILCVH